MPGVHVVHSLLLSLDVLNPILHTWFRDSFVSGDGSSAIKVSPCFLLFFNILISSNILQYFFSKSVHGNLTIRCVKYG